MRRLTIVLCALTGLLALAGSAPAARAQFYIGAAAGANFEPDSDVNGGVSGKASYDQPGYATSGVIGYRIGLSDSFALDVEGEFAYRHNNVDAFKPSGGAKNKDGSTQSFAWLGNVWLNWLIGDTGFQPYVGGGAGAVHIDVNNAQIGAVELKKESDLVVGGQVGAGLGYQVTQHLLFSLDYRYLFTDDATMQGLDVSYETHALLLRARYLF